MKIFRIFSRGIRDAGRSIIRNFSLSLASIISVSITLLIVSFAIIVTENVNNVSNKIKSDVTIVVFLESNTTKKQVDELYNNIKKMNNVENIVYKSKIEIRDDLKKDSPALYTILDDWDVNDLPIKDSFKIKVKDLKEIKQTATYIKTMKKVSLVNYGETTVNKLLGAFSLINKIMYIAVITLILVTVFLIVNTIKLTIYSRKRAIEIMRVVGASNLAIKFPFVIEGMILGFLGSIFPIFFSIYIYARFFNKFKGVLFSNIIKMIEPSYLVTDITIIALSLGVVVGMIGSSSAVRKYLKL